MSTTGRTSKAEDPVDDGDMTLTEESVQGIGSLLLVLMLFVVAAGLLLFTPLLTKAPPPNMGYHTHPAFFPSFALTLWALGSGLVALRCLLRSWPLNLRELTSSIFSKRWQPVPLALLFAAYISMVSLLGYIPATVLFVGITLALVRVTFKHWVAGTVILPLLCWVVFVWIFDVWFPAAVLF